MNNASALLSALGGAAVFVAGIWAVVRGVALQTIATRENSEATRKLTTRMDQLTGQVDDHGRRIGLLERRNRRDR